MNTAYHAMLNTGKTTTEQALQLFDKCEPVTLDFMIGRWQGRGLRTDHPLDGMLETSRWYGKEFIDYEQVHPLLFLDLRGNIFKVAPNSRLINAALKFPLLTFVINTHVPSLPRLANSWLSTEKSQARLRMMEYRGQVSAAMIYDYLPINDYFRELEDNMVLGVMDYKQLPQPLFFVLTRCN